VTDWGFFLCVLGRRWRVRTGGRGNNGASLVQQQTWRTAIKIQFIYAHNLILIFSRNFRWIPFSLFFLWLPQSVEMKFNCNLLGQHKGEINYGWTKM